MTQTIEHSLSQRLKAQTHDTHDQLDRSIMETASFDTVDGYGRFVCMQYHFHRDIHALYDDAALQALLPGLVLRRRLDLIVADLTDLAIEIPVVDAAPVFPQNVAIDVPTALGWLYVAEGSNMGAALLRKEAAKLGLSDDHGARHLAPPPEGPAAHWRAFTAGLNAAVLSADEEARVSGGAQAAFAQVGRHAHAAFA